LKILFYSPAFYPSVGGLENISLMLAKALQNKHSCQVKVISFTRIKENTTDLDIYAFPSLLKQAQLFFWCTIFYMPNLSLKGCWLLFLNPFKRWVISHNNWYERADGTKSYKDLVKLMMCYFARNISVSNAIAKHIPFDSKVIHNCYDNKQFYNTYQLRNRDFLFVGRLVASKGIYTLVEAVRIIKQKKADIIITVVGDGNEKDNFLKRIKDLNIEKNFFFSGVKIGNELLETFNQHKWLIVPSQWEEPFGIVVLEGLACGCNVIATNKGGLKEAGGDLVTYFENGNYHQLAEILIDIIDNKFTFQPPINEQIKKHLSNYTIESVSKKYLSIFN
jgi:glycogen synthase